MQFCHTCILSSGNFLQNIELFQTSCLKKNQKNMGSFHLFLSGIIYYRVWWGETYVKVNWFLMNLIYYTFLARSKIEDTFNMKVLTLLYLISGNCVFISVASHQLNKDWINNIVMVPMVTGGNAIRLWFIRGQLSSRKFRVFLFQTWLSNHVCFLTFWVNLFSLLLFGHMVSVYLYD